MGADGRLAVDETSLGERRAIADVEDKLFWLVRRTEA
jgi:hypothetical protein